MTFKVGDQVVVVRNHRNITYIDYVGRVFIIDTISDKAAFPKEDASSDYGAYLEDIELELVATSPLWEALK